MRNQRNWPEERGTHYTHWHIDQNLVSGQPATTVLDQREAYGGYPDSPDTKVPVRLEGRDSALFDTANGDSTAFDRDGDGEYDTIKYDVMVRLARPLPAGVYRFDLNEDWSRWTACDYVISNEWTVTVTSLADVLHELLFDPVTVGSDIAADDTNGVLNPASFIGADGTSATIGRIAYEPSSAGSGQAGTVKLAITAGSHPDDVLGERLWDFIELDGSVSHSLHVFDSTVDTGSNTGTGTNYTLTWDVASQPWEDGDQLMVRIRTAPPSCRSRSVIPDARNAPGLVGDCETLLGLKDELAGTAALNWSADIAMSAWDGVTIGGNPRRVTQLALERKGLTGTVPPAIGELTGLRELNLGRNQLTGSIPGSLGRLTNLTNLGLESNRLTGPIPAELGALTGLVFLHLHSNSLTGPIPPEIGNLVDLYDLFLQDNDLSGPIPSEIGDIGELGRLWLSGNRLSGTIPAELTGLTRLTLLVLSGNNLVGCVPPSLKDIRTNDLDDLRLRDCLDGPPAPAGVAHQPDCPVLAYRQP